MILLYTIGGRTGNLLFQFAYALSARKANEWLVSVGFGKVRSLLEGPCRRRWLNMEGRLVRTLMDRFLHPVLYRFLVRTRVVASDYENNDIYEIRQGWIRRIRVMKGYFQSSERQAPNLRHLMRLEERLRDRARPLLASIAAGYTPVFVHLRRSDYEGVMIGGYSARLPDHYYLEAVRKLSAAGSRLFFFIVGDDPDHAERLFRELEPKYVSRLPLEEDLALMSLCEGGVLSNSNFAWWGAFFSPSRMGYIAPRYWSGWRVKKWFPPELRGTFVNEYLDIRPN